MKRIFIVGFARSGTSLLHSMVASYPGVCGFTESSYYFHRYVNPLERFPIAPFLSDKFYLPRFFVKSKIDVVMKTFISENLIDSNSVGDKKFIGILDAKCAQLRCDAWVEKSTVHLRRIPVIQKLQPEAMFIHVIRRFPAVLQSWNFACKNMGLDFFDASEMKIFRYWKRDLMRTVKYVSSDPRHHMVISYQALCNDTEKVIDKLNFFLDKTALLDDIKYKRTNSGVVLARESWKDNVRLGIKPATGVDLRVEKSIADELYNNAVMSMMSQKSSCL